MSTLTFNVPDISCAHCEAALHKALDGLPGVAGVQVDLNEKMVAVSGEGLDTNALLAAIDDAGYDATLS